MIADESKSRSRLDCDLGEPRLSRHQRNYLGAFTEGFCFTQMRAKKPLECQSDWGLFSTASGFFGSFNETQSTLKSEETNLDVVSVASKILPCLSGLLVDGFADHGDCCFDSVRLACQGCTKTVFATFESVY